MKREFKVEANVGAPQVAYRETISKTYECDYTHKKQTGGSGQFARVKIRFEPNEAGAGFVFDNAVVGGTVPKEYVPGVEKGLKCGAWTPACSPASRWSTSRRPCIDGAYHDVDFERAGVRNRRPRRLPRRHRQGRAEAAGADDAGRGGDARGLHGRRHRRSEQPSRPGQRHGQPRQRPRHRRHGAAGQHVRLCQHPALDEPGPCPIHACTSITTPKCPQNVSEEIRAKLAG